ncbi:NACHT domain-containing protein [Nocardia sp. GCM10030253]|uniref:NACHT domain-containing protein n=1 Tax=Nocardia sp. GCM10030253 TaxID=3273404 RepID=UPI0036337F44
MTGAELGAAARVAGSAAKGLSLLWRWWNPDTSLATVSVKADELAELVQRIEQRRLGELGVVRGEGVDIQWEALARVRAAGGEEFGWLVDVARYYRSLSPQRLVVLGESGAGKTVTAIHLLLGLLKDGPAEIGYRRHNSVPVRFNAASWDPTRANFSSWMASQLADDYGLRRQVAAAMIEAERILPLLDGLDEMDTPTSPPSRARAALDELNEPEWRGRPVVVMCRTATYRLAQELGSDSGLHSATAVILRPLNSVEVRTHLERHRDSAGIDPDRWQPIIRELDINPGGTLARSLQTPWLLTLAIDFLQRAAPPDVVQLATAADEQTVRETVFTAMIPAAVAGLRRERSGAKRYTAVQVTTWLRSLAQHLDSARARGGNGAEIKLFEVWKLAGRNARILHTILLFPIFTIACMSFLGVATVVVLAPIFGLCFALISGSAGPKRAHRVGVRWRSRSGSTLRGLGRGVAQGLVTGVVLGAVVLVAIVAVHGLALGFWDSAMEWGLAFGMSLALCLGVVLALMFALTTHDEPNLDERANIREDLLSGAVVGGAFGVAYFLHEWIVLPLAMHASQAIVYDPWTASLLKDATMGGNIVDAAAGMVVYTIAFGLWWSRASVRYGIARALLIRGSRFTWRPSPFLDWARSSGLLRVTGAAYQFRHQTYQQWLLSEPANAPSGAAAAAPDSTGKRSE